jgi:membrane protease subunit (stomatin/prohibitin family)
MCECGTDNTGKFCQNCGKQKSEANGWACTCGTVNQGKFCQNCGSKRPEGAPLYKCDKCGWIPEDPMNPPKFCPECGDIFDESDQ